MSLDLSGWDPPDRGALFVVTGASGTGKTTLVQEAIRVVPGLVFSVSATTRRPREGEVDGRDYHFVSEARFDMLLAEHALLEWAEVHGNRYGTPRRPVERALADGQSVLLEIDHQGASQVRKAMPDAVTIFILPPSLEAIEERLRRRGSDPRAVIEHRIRDARQQLAHCGEFDYLIVNDVLESAHDQFQAVLVAELRRRRRLDSLVARFMAPAS